MLPDPCCKLGATQRAHSQVPQCPQGLLLSGDDARSLEARSPACPTELQTFPKLSGHGAGAEPWSLSLPY